MVTSFLTGCASSSKWTKLWISQSFMMFSLKSTISFNGNLLSVPHSRFSTARKSKSMRLYGSLHPDKLKLQVKPLGLKVDIGPPKFPFSNVLSLENFAKRVGTTAILITLVFELFSEPAMAKRREGVNKPELLPDYFTRVIDVAGFLSAGQEQRINKDLERLETDTGFKLRVLAQNYPETPGLAIKDYWGVDENTVVLVADPSLSGNLLNFNVGSDVDLSVPRNFWSRVSGKFGNVFYWREKGEDSAIESAVIAIDACLRDSPSQCSSYFGSD